jgi:hypothetical protein
MSEARPGESGYRGALPPRNDWLARGWVLVVIAIFLSLFVLDALGIPSSLLPAPTPSVAPAPSGSAEPSPSPDASGSASPGASRSPAESPAPTP